MQDNKEYILRNRYGSPTKLVNIEGTKMWELSAPKALYISASYEGSINNPKYVMVDPEGGPALYVGDKMEECGGSIAFIERHIGQDGNEHYILTIE